MLFAEQYHPADLVPIPDLPGQFYPMPGTVVASGIFAAPGLTLHVQFGSHTAPAGSWEYRPDSREIVWLGVPEQLDPAYRSWWWIRREDAIVDAWHARQEREREQRFRRERRDRANAKAERLLLSMLDERQRVDLVNCGYFTIVGSAGNRYRINRGYSQNVDLVDENGLEVANLCAYPDRATAQGDLLPVADCMVGQMLVLTADERIFHGTPGLGRAIYDLPAYDAAMARIYPDYEPPRLPSPAGVDRIGEQLGELHDAMTRAGNAVGVLQRSVHEFRAWIDRAGVQLSAESPLRFWHNAVMPERLAPPEGPREAVLTARQRDQEARARGQAAFRTARRRRRPGFVPAREARGR